MSDIQVVTTEKRSLDTYTITELIHWRNTASFGATDLSKRIAFLEKELAMANKERLSKVRWIRRLNTIIARMAFPKRDKHEGV